MENKREIFEKQIQQTQFEIDAKNQLLRQQQLELLRLNFLETLERTKRKIEKLNVNEFEELFSLSEKEINDQFVFVNFHLIDRPNQSHTKLVENIEIDEQFETEEEVDFSNEAKKDYSNLFIPFFQTIAETGVATRKDLIRMLNTIYEKRYSEEEAAAAISYLLHAKYLRQEGVKLNPYSSKFNRVFFELSPLGKSFYEHIFGKEPVKSKIQELKDEYGELSYFYLVFETLPLLEKLGFGYKQKDNYFLLNKSKTSYALYIEIDKLSVDDFEDVIGKLYKESKEIICVAPNEEVLFGKTKTRLINWVNNHLGGIDPKKSKVQFHLTTFAKLKTNQPFQSFKM